MLEFWSFRVVEVSSVRILKLSGCLVSEFSFEFFELLGSQVVRVFEFSRIRVFEFSSCRDFEFSSCRVVGCPSCGVFEFSGFRVFEFSNFRDFEFSNGTDGGEGWRVGSESEQTRRPVIIFMSLELGGGGGGRVASREAVVTAY